MKYITVILLFGFLTACSSEQSGKEKYKEEIEQIDSYSKQVEEEMARFMALDSNKLTQIPKDYDEMKRVMTSYYQSDTVQPKLAAKINMFKGLKDVKHYKANKKRFLKSAEYTLSQLSDLKRDLEGDSLDEEIDLKDAMELEAKGATEIIGVLNSYTELLTKNLAIYDSLNPQVQIIVDSLRTLHEGSD